MKKRGFTLVELLAVIAILAILVIVAMPNVIDMFNQAKINTFVTEVQKIMDISISQFTQDALKNSGKTIYYSSVDSDKVDTNKLDLSGNNKEYFVEMDRNGDFKRVIVYDDNFCYDIYSENGNMNSYGTKSKKISDKIQKTTVISNDIWLSGNDSVEVIDDSGSYKINGCQGSEKAIKEDIKIITFTIMGEEYQAEEGMTWGEWINSDYNVNGMCRNTAQLGVMCNGSRLQSPTYTQVGGSRVIQEGEVYR